MPKQEIKSNNWQVHENIIIKKGKRYAISRNVSVGVLVCLFDFNIIIMRLLIIFIFQFKASSLSRENKSSNKPHSTTNCIKKKVLNYIY